MDDLARDPRSLQLLSRRILKSADASHLVLVIDQFENYLRFATLRRSAFHYKQPAHRCFPGRWGGGCHHHAARRFLCPLRKAMSNCAALAKNQEYIGAMSDEELRRAIEEPARRGRWEYEPGLVDLLLHDVGHEPGALPLLSHALLETWRRRRGRTMALSCYTSSGGVRGNCRDSGSCLPTSSHRSSKSSPAHLPAADRMGDETARTAPPRP
jgi:hypothetical protein